MRKTRKQFFAVMLALVMCLSQNAALFAAEEIASMTEEVSDNKIPEESVEAEGSVSKNEISENEISENETPETPISKNEIDEISDSEESANGVEITWGDYTATRDDEAMTLTLTKYNGNASSITVPATATIDGKSYRIVLTFTYKHDDKNNVDYQTSIWSDDPNLTSISFSDGFKAPNNCFCIFRGCSNLTSLDLKNFDTSDTTYMGNMFENCSSLTSLDVSGLNTSKVTGMGAMFSGCSSLQSLNVSNFDTSKVSNMVSIFSGCSNLKTLNISNFDTSNVSVMSYMFYNCSELINLDLSNFDTSKVTDMEDMFYRCRKLKSLNISNFDTSKVSRMVAMFSGCSELINLDLSNFDTSNVTYMMNTADRSLAMMDYALRRRFAFFNIAPGFDSEGFRAYKTDLDNSKFDSLIACVQELNKKIASDESLGDGFCIGHSYFCNLEKEDITDAKLHAIVDYELIPMLKEYWFDEPLKVTEWSDNLRRAIK